MQPTISREFALVLASMHGEHAEIVEGQAGRAFPMELHFPNTEILGSIDTGHRAITFVADRSPEHRTLLDRVSKALLGSGYTLLAPPSRGGFASRRTGEPSIFNREDCSILVAQRAAPNGGTVVSVAVGEPMPKKFHEFSARMHPMPALPIPVLSEPPGIEQHQTGGGGSDTSQDMRALMMTTDKSALNVTTASAHHALDFESQGWQHVGSDFRNDRAIMCFVLDTPDGKMFGGLYSIARLPKHHEGVLHFTITTLRSERDGSSTRWSTF